MFSHIFDSSCRNYIIQLKKNLFQSYFLVLFSDQYGTIHKLCTLQGRQRGSRQIGKSIVLFDVIILFKLHKGKNVSENHKTWTYVLYWRSLFLLIYGFNQAFWLNLITLWTFFKTDSWFNAYFKFLWWITYSVLSCKLATSISTFSILILSGKNGKSLWRLRNFSGYWTSTSRKYPLSLSSL